MNHPKDSFLHPAQPAVPLRFRLLLVAVALALIGIGWYSGSRQSDRTDRIAAEEIPAYDFSYDEVLTEQSVDIKTAPKPSKTARAFYLWTEGHWKDKDRLNEVKAMLALTGLRSQAWPAGEEAHYHFRLGPFESVSDRNNARQALIKQNLPVRITAPKNSN